MGLVLGLSRCERCRAENASSEETHQTTQTKLDGLEKKKQLHMCHEIGRMKQSAECVQEALNPTSRASRTLNLRHLALDAVLDLP